MTRDDTQHMMSPYRELKHQCILLIHSFTE